MKRTPEQLKQFVLDTLLPYKNNPDTCGWNTEEGVCQYLTPEGKKCAVGKHMREDCGWNYFHGPVEDLVYKLRQAGSDLDAILTDEAQGVPYPVWKDMQLWHDTLGSGGDPNSKVSVLSARIGLPMDELKFTQEEVEAFDHA